MSIQSLVRRAGLAVLALAPALAVAQDAGRLPTGVTPTFEEIRLDLDPRQSGYTGSVRVELQVAAPLTSFAFHAEEMQVTALKLTGAAATAVATPESSRWIFSGTSLGPRERTTRPRVWPRAWKRKRSVARRTSRWTATDPE